MHEIVQKIYSSKLKNHICKSSYIKDELIIIEILFVIYEYENVHICK